MTSWERQREGEGEGEEKEEKFDYIEGRDGLITNIIVLPCDQIRVSADHKHLAIPQQCAEGGAVLNNAHHLRQHTSVLMRVSLAGRFSCVFQSALHNTPTKER